jgi:hypothetical protein
MVLRRCRPLLSYRALVSVRKPPLSVEPVPLSRLFSDLQPEIRRNHEYVAGMIQSCVRLLTERLASVGPDG